MTKRFIMYHRHYSFLMLFLSCFVEEVSGQDDIQDCPYIPANNKVTSFGDYCLQFVHSERSWGDARHQCRRHGGDLVQIKDIEMQQYIVHILHFLHWDKHGVWIGATDSDREGVWKWVSGEALRYGDWHPGQGPSQHGFIFSSGATEDCALLRLDDGGRWHDYPCNGGVGYHYTYICQYKRKTKPVIVPNTGMIKETDPPRTTTTPGAVITETAATVAVNVSVNTNTSETISET